MPPDSLQKILIQQGASNLPLPPLKEAPAPLNSLVSDLMQWIAKWLPTTMPSLGADPRVLLQAFALALVAAGIAALVFYCAQRRNRSSEAKPENAVRELPVEALELKMREALEKGDYAQAARFRWRLLLLRRGFPQSRTPREVFPESVEWMPHYRLMFCPSADAQGDFDRFHQWAERNEENKGRQATV